MGSPAIVIVGSLMIACNPLFDKYCYGNSTARLPLWIKPDRRLQNDSHSPPGGKCVISNRWFVAKKESDNFLGR